MDYDIAYTEDANNFIHDIVDSALECAQYAKSIGGAFFWSWDHEYKFCYPKTSDTGRGAAPGTRTSGTVACGSGAGNNFFA